MSTHSLSQIASLPQKDRLSAYLSLLPTLYSSSPLPDLVNLIDHLINDPSVSLVTGRQVYSEVVGALTSEGGKAIKGGQEMAREVIEKVLETVKNGTSASSIANYEEQTTALRLHLAGLLESEEDWEEAAKVLIAVPLDSSNSKFNDAQKLDHLVHIVRLLIEVGDNGQAQTYFNRASLLIHDCKDPTVRLGYKLCHARLFDFSRKFNEAARVYYELSNIPNLDEEDRLQALSAATTCSILAPAGPARLTTLSLLHQDERTPTLPTYTILSKMFLENIIRPAEVVEFENGLQPHQLARLPAQAKGIDVDDSSDEEGEGDVKMGGAGLGGEKKSRRMAPETVLDRAVMEHNLLSCAKLYVNISFSGLGALLDLAPSGAETMARKMIEQERLRGWIDQIDKLIWFEGRDDAPQTATAGGLGDVEREPLHFQNVSLTERWDANIGKTAEKVEMIANLIKSRGLLEPIVSGDGVGIEPMNIS